MRSSTLAPDLAHEVDARTPAPAQPAQVASRRLPRIELGAGCSFVFPFSANRAGACACARPRSGRRARRRRLLQRSKLVIVDLDLLEVALDHVLHRASLAPWLRNCLRASASPEVVERRAERGDAVDEAAHRVPARGEKKLGSPRAARSTGSCSRAIWRASLRRHLGVGEDLRRTGCR